MPENQEPQTLPPTQERVLPLFEPTHEEEISKSLLHLEEELHEWDDPDPNPCNRLRRENSPGREKNLPPQLRGIEVINESIHHRKPRRFHPEALSSLKYNYLTDSYPPRFAIINLKEPTGELLLQVNLDQPEATPVPFQQGISWNIHKHFNFRRAIPKKVEENSRKEFDKSKKILTVIQNLALPSALFLALALWTPYAYDALLHLTPNLTNPWQAKQTLAILALSFLSLTGILAILLLPASKQLAKILPNTLPKIFKKDTLEIPLHFRLPGYLNKTAERKLARLAETYDSLYLLWNAEGLWTPNAFQPTYQSLNERNQTAFIVGEKNGELLYLWETKLQNNPTNHTPTKKLK